MDKLHLQWDEFKQSIAGAFRTLREEKDFADVTLVCEDGEMVEVHKVVLAASSSFFKNILKRNKQAAHPLIYMRGVKSDDLLAILDFQAESFKGLSYSRPDSDIYGVSMSKKIARTFWPS